MNKDLENHFKDRVAAEEKQQKELAAKMLSDSEAYDNAVLELGGGEAPQVTVEGDVKPDAKKKDVKP